MSVFRRKTYEEQEWISVADLMSGLMLLFLALAVFYMLTLGKAVEGVTGIRGDIGTGIAEAIEDDSLRNWRAVFDTVTLTMSFQDPEVLFEQGSAVLTDEFKGILDGFFPMWLGVLTTDEYRDHITEMRIEGHTSSDWEGEEGLMAYEQNMALSHRRSLSVLSYVVRLSVSQKEWDSWLRERLTANGLSSSKVIRVNGVEDRAKSRRVDFSVRTDAEERLRRLFGEDGLIGRYMVGIVQEGER